MDSVISWAIITAAGLASCVGLLIRRAEYLGSAHTGFNPCPGANSICASTGFKFAQGGSYQHDLF